MQLSASFLRRAATDVAVLLGKLFLNRHSLLQFGQGFGMLAQFVFDQRDAIAGQGQLTLKRRVAGMLLEKALIIGERRLEQFSSQRLQTGHAEQFALAYLGEEIVHRVAGLLNFPRLLRDVAWA